MVVFSETVAEVSAEALAMLPGTDNMEKSAYLFASILQHERPRPVISFTNDRKMKLHGNWNVMAQAHNDLDRWISCHMNMPTDSEDFASRQRQLESQSNEIGSSQPIQKSACTSTSRDTDTEFETQDKLCVPGLIQHQDIPVDIGAELRILSLDQTVSLQTLEYLDLPSHGLESDSGLEKFTEVLKGQMSTSNKCETSSKPQDKMLSQEFISDASVKDFLKTVVWSGSSTATTEKYGSHHALTKVKGHPNVATTTSLRHSKRVLKPTKKALDNATARRQAEGQISFGDCVEFVSKESGGFMKKGSVPESSKAESVPECSISKQDVDTTSSENGNRRKFSSHLQILRSLYARLSTKGPDQYHCKNCNFETPVWRNMRLHIKRNHIELPYKQISNKPFGESLDGVLQDYDRAPVEADELSLLKEMQARLYSCQECDFCSSNRESLKRHQSRNHKEKNFKCHICPKSFALNVDLTQHVKYHEDSFTCKNCGKVLKSRQAIDYHMKVVHEGQVHLRASQKYSFLCKECGKIFHCKRDHDSHQNKEHLNVRPFACQQCGKAFFSKAGLRHHQVIHTEQKKYKCSQCDKAFKWYGCYREHEHVHTKVRPYQCSTCDATFSHRSSLKRHNRTHTGEKLYTCAFCAVQFADMTTAKKHLRGRHEVTDKELLRASMLSAISEAQLDGDPPTISEEMFPAPVPDGDPAPGNAEGEVSEVIQILESEASTSGFETLNLNSDTIARLSEKGEIFLMLQHD